MTGSLNWYNKYLWHEHHLWGLYLNVTLILRQKDRKIIRQKMMNRSQKTSRRPTRSEKGGMGRWGDGVIKIFWSIELNDLSSKKICRPKLIYWSGAKFILWRSCFHWPDLLLLEKQYSNFLKIMQFLLLSNELSTGAKILASLFW